jgi:lysine decarboxylase
LGVSPAALTTALDTDPRPGAVLLTRPSYYGIARELAELVAICRARQVPLIVDEAHGAHLHFLAVGAAGRGAAKNDEARMSNDECRKPCADDSSFGHSLCVIDPSPPRLVGPTRFPQPALAAGADLVVQSCHKTLGSLVGSAQLHVGRESRIDPARVQDALNFLQTTSPSFLLLASLDVMRRWMWREGHELFAAAVEEARLLEEQIDAMPGLQVLRPENDPRLAGHQRDPLRLVVSVSDTGWNGYDVERYLRTEFQVEDEMADWFNVVYVLSPEDDPAARERLLAGLRAVSEQRATQRIPGKEQGGRKYSSQLLAPGSALLQPPIPPLAMPPRKAALAQKTAVPLVSAAGRTCAEMVMFYPPGIPMLMPGEMVTEETIDVCRHLLAAGAHPYASDPALETIRVVA